MESKSIILSIALVFFCTTFIYGQEMTIDYVKTLYPDPTQTKGTYGVQVVDNYAYTATYHIGLTIFDVTDPLNAQVVGNLNLPTIMYHNFLTVEGDYAYLSGRDDYKLYIKKHSQKKNNNTYVKLLDCK